MTILDIKLDSVGEVGVTPRTVKIKTNNTIAEVTATGFLNNSVQDGFNFAETDLCVVSTSVTSGQAPTQTGIFEIAKSGDNWSLVSTGNPGEVILPTVAARMAMFTNTTGEMASSVTSGSGDGSVALASLGQNTAFTLVDPGAATGNIPVTTGALVDDNIITADGVAGRMQDSGVGISDVQLSANIIAGVTADIGGGGAGPIAVSVTGLTASSVVVATIQSSSNAVSVVSTVAGTNDFDITFSGDPGAACVVNYVAFVAAQ